MCMHLTSMFGMEAFIWLMVCFALVSERRTRAVIESAELPKLITAMLCFVSGIGWEKGKWREGRAGRRTEAWQDLCFSASSEIRLHLVQ